MRLRLSLKSLAARTSVPLNYNYPVSAAVYKLLNQACPEYAGWLHDRGYKSPANRLLKLFTFSRLDIPAVKRIENSLQSNSPDVWALYISSPMEKDFVQNFVLGLFKQSRLQIGNREMQAQFMIENIESLSMPDFKPVMQGKMLSSCVISTAREYNGKMQPYYLRPDDAGISEAIRHNLISKFTTISGHPPHDDSFKLDLDFAYFKRRKGRVSKLISIKEGSPEETRLKTFIMPFQVTGSTELMQTAWECGIGDKNSLGLGMIDLW